jgi:hypothetical protein
MWTENCPIHGTVTKIYEVGEEGQFVDDNLDENAIFRSLPIPKRGAVACGSPLAPGEATWLRQRAAELYEAE